MEGKEDLFDDVDFTDNSAVDSSEFEKEPVVTDDTTDDDAGDDDSPANDNKDKSKDIPGVIDSTFFEKEIENQDSVDDPSADSSSSPLQLLASTLRAEGLIDLEEDEEVKDSKDLLAAWRKTIAKNELSDLTEEQKTYVQALRNGIPEEEVKQNFNNIKALESVTNESITANEGLRKTLIAQDFIAKGIDEAKAMKLAERSVDLGEDIDDAKEALNSLKEIEKTRIVKTNAQREAEKKAELKQAEEKLSKLKEVVLNKEEFIPNMKVNATTKEKIFKNMTEIAEYDSKGNPLNAITAARMKDPENFEMMESFFFTITKGFTDFSKFTKSVKSTAIDELDKSLQSNNVGGGTPNSIRSTSSKGLADAIANYKI